MRTYEGMFLVDAGNPDTEAMLAPIRTALARVDADVLSLKPWDERRLMYEIAGRKRGLYVLAYFKVQPGRLGELEHEVRLEERILRCLFLSADHVSPEKIQAETPATLSQSRRSARAEGEAPREAGGVGQPTGAAGEPPGGPAAPDAHAQPNEPQQPDQPPQADQPPATT